MAGWVVASIRHVVQLLQYEEYSKALAFNIFYLVFKCNCYSDPFLTPIYPYLNYSTLTQPVPLAVLLVLYHR